MTIQAFEVAKNADLRYFESYTALWPKEDLIELENKIGEITTVMRPFVEDPEELLSLAKKKNVVLLIVGDPLQATTHVDLQLQAEQCGVKCDIVHGVSITGIITGALGLSNYKFGRQTTITYPYGGWVPTSPLETIAINRYNGQHTLALLDLDPTGEGVGGQRPMQPKDAADAIISMSEKIMHGLEEGSIQKDPLHVKAVKDLCLNIHDLPLVLCTDMGTKNQSINSITLSELYSANEGGLHCLVIPSELTDIEKSALSRWAK